MPEALLERHGPGAGLDALTPLAPQLHPLHSICPVFVQFCPSPLQTTTLGSGVEAPWEQAHPDPSCECRVLGLQVSSMLSGVSMDSRCWAPLAPVALILGGPGAMSPSSHQALCSPGSVPAVTSHVIRPRGWAAAGVQRACVLICIFTSFPPTPENSRCCEGSVCGRLLGPQQAGWFLPSSSCLSSLLPASSSQGRVPGLWDGKQEPRSGRSRH